MDELKLFMKLWRITRERTIFGQNFRVDKPFKIELIVFLFVMSSFKFEPESPFFIG